MCKVNLSLDDVVEAGRCICNAILRSPGGNTKANLAIVQAVYDSFDFEGWTNKANKEGLPRADGDIWYEPGRQWIAVLENDLHRAYYKAYAA